MEKTFKPGQEVWVYSIGYRPQKKKIIGIKTIGSYLTYTVGWDIAGEKYQCQVSHLDMYQIGDESELIERMKNDQFCFEVAIENFEKEVNKC